MDSQFDKLIPGTVHSVQTLAATEPVLNEGGIRWDIFQNKDELLQAGAIFYIGKKLVIDRDRYVAFHKNRRVAA